MSELPLSDIRVLDLTPPASRRLLLAAARRLRRRRGQGRGHRHGRLRALGAAVLRRRLDSSSSAPARRSTWRSTAASARSVSTSSPTSGATRSCAWPASTTSCSRAFAPGSSTSSAAATRRCAEANPGIVYCAITGYGQTGPNTGRAGHDMNYLGLTGLLGLTGERDGPPIQAAGQIADLGGGGADGRLRGDGGAARARALGRGPAGRRLDDRRGALLAGDGRRRSTSATARFPSADGGCSAAASPATCRTSAPTAGSPAVRSSRSSGSAFCDGAGRPDLIEHQFAAPGSDGHAAGRRRLSRAHTRAVARVQRRARRDDRAGARSRRGARLRAGSRARDGGRARAARARAGAPARPSGEALAHARRPDAGRRRRLASTPSEVLAEAGFSERGDRRSCSSSGAAAGPAEEAGAARFMG